MFIKYFHMILVLLLEILGDLFKFEKSSCLWQKLDASVSFPRFRHTLSTVESHIIVLGGWEAEGKLSKHAHCFNIQQNSWKQLAETTMQRCAHSAVVTSDNTVLVFGGEICENGERKLTKELQILRYDDDLI